MEGPLSTDYFNKHSTTLEWRRLEEFRFRNLDLNGKYARQFNILRRLHNRDKHPRWQPTNDDEVDVPSAFSRQDEPEVECQARDLYEPPYSKLRGLPEPAKSSLKVGRLCRKVPNLRPRNSGAQNPQRVLNVEKDGVISEQECLHRLYKPTMPPTRLSKSQQDSHPQIKNGIYYINFLAPFSTLQKPTCGYHFDSANVYRLRKLDMLHSDRSKWRSFAIPNLGPQPCLVCTTAQKVTCSNCSSKQVDQSKLVKFTP